MTAAFSALGSWLGAPGMAPEPIDVLDDRFGSFRSLPSVGTIGLYAVIVFAAATFAISLAASRRPRLLTVARSAAYATCALVVFDLLLLAYAFVTHDFRIRYVARYSDRSMATGYLLTALWGGQDGSLLWWIFLLSVNTTACVAWMGKKWRELQPYVIATLVTIIGFFGVIMAFSANPFAESVAGTRVDGEGLNPLLQNFYMIIHPPSLYTGFVGCSVPFAFGVAALASGRLGEEWLVAVRKWMLWAWLFLSIGNVLGMLWAYEELGWGGYWAWDPVENAAFMPWLTASAFVHSTMIQERRRMLKIWNVALIAQTFFMTIWGTFLTRSGMISSVHAFAQSSIGIYFTYFMVTIATVAAALVVYRLPELKNFDIDQTGTRRYREIMGPIVVGLISLAGVGMAIAIARATSASGLKDASPTTAAVIAGLGAAGVLAIQSRATGRPLSIYWVPAVAFVGALGYLALPGKMLPLGILALVTVQVLAGLGMAFMRRTFTGADWGDYTPSIALAVLFGPFTIVGCAVYWIACKLASDAKSTADAKTRQAAAHATIDSIASREAAFVANNWILVGMQLFVGLTTAFPLISEGLFGEKVTVGPAFYNRWMVPFGLALFALMGIGPLLGWRKSSPGALKKAFRIPLIAVGVTAVAHLAVGKALGFPAYVPSDPIYPGAMGKALAAISAVIPVLATSLAAFNVAVIVQEYTRGIAARRKTNPKEGLLAALMGLVAKARRRYGGYIVHAGIVVMFLGFTGAAYKVDAEFAMKPGESVDFAGYKMTFIGPRRVDSDPAKMEVYTDVRLERGGTDLGVLHPAKFIYRRQQMPTSEVAIKPGPRADVYIAPGSVNPETKLATIHVYVNPLTSWIWLGAMILILGAAVAMWPDPEVEEVRAMSWVRAGGAVASSLIFGLLLAFTPARAFAQTGGGSSSMAGEVHMNSEAEKTLFSRVLCMCGGCERLPLSNCTCDWADNMRKKLSARLAAGDSIDAITEAYGKEHGIGSLNVPPSRGYLKSIWIVPSALVVIGGIGAFFVVRSWTKKPKGPTEPPADKGAAAPPKDDYDAKLDAELDQDR
jgi:cytochrome c-type biogenesis protein CcmF